MRSTDVDQALPKMSGMLLGLSRTESMTFGHCKTVSNILIRCFIVSDKINTLNDFVDFVEILSFPSHRWSPICGHFLTLRVGFLMGVGYQYQRFGMSFGVQLVYFQHLIDLPTPSAQKIDFRKKSF